MPLPTFTLAEDLRALQRGHFGEDALSVLDDDESSVLDVRHSLESRNIEGGTGPQAVDEQMEKARAVLAAESAKP